MRPRWLLLVLAVTGVGRAALATPTRANHPSGSPPAVQRSTSPASAVPGEERVSRGDQGRKESARQHFEVALRAYDDGDYEAAIAALERALAEDPEGRDLLFNLAVVHERLGQHAAALARFRQLLALEGDGAERERLQRIIRRVEGAASRARRGAPRPASPAVESTPAPTAGLQGLAVGTGGVAALAGAIGSVFSIRAFTAPSGEREGPALVANVALLVSLVSGGVTWWLATRPAGPARPAAGAR